MATATRLRRPTAATAFQALADDTRLAILDQLVGGERCVCDITEALRITQPLLSFHLRVLREAGLVQARREGRWAYYTMDSAGLARARAGLDRYARAAKAVPVAGAECCG